MSINESHVEDATLAWLESLGYAVLHGPEIVLRLGNGLRSLLNTGSIAWSRGTSPT